ncbi:MAG: hypothetical protein DI597_12965 [Pseudoxanthomonas spadix]|nr:MAG: hypothetical protein DI597_12965 [Pseudoxanthomonas spadix]
MTESTFDDQGRKDAPLPEDSQQQLRQVGSQLRLLARLARPRPGGKPRKQAPALGAAELASSLDQLAGQVEAILQRMSWPVQTGPAPEAAAADTAAEATRATPVEGARLAFGATMAQLDALQLLVSSIKAFGDAVFAEQAADYAQGSVSMLGYAIFNQASEVADLLTEIATQPLAHGADRLAVREVPGTYGAWPGLLSHRGDPAAAWLPRAMPRLPKATRLH